MKKRVLLVALLILPCLAVTAQEESQLVVKHTYQSQLARQSLSVEVMLPEHYDKGAAYPVLFTTSGSRRRDVMRSQLNWLSHVEMGAFPPLIIVSVPDIEVETHLHPKNIGAAGITHQITTRVLEKEIIPWVEKRFLTRPFRILEGYSSYGNFPLYVLLHQPMLFNAYIGVTPALGLDQTDLLKVWEAVSSDNGIDYTQRFLFLSRGDFAENVEPMAKAKSLLERNVLAGLNWQFLDQSQHNFLMPAVTDTALALETLFADTRIRDFSPFRDGGVKGISAHFQALEKKYGYAMEFSSTLIDFAFYLSAEKRHTQALSAMQTLLEQEPENLFYLTRFASLQEAASKPRQARITLEKALQLAEGENNQDAIAFIRQMLSELSV